MLGQTLGTYRVTALIGEGGMGRVYVAEHALIGRRAAVKVLLPEFSQRAEIVDRFFNEARALAQLRHPGLVDVFDYGRHTDGSAYVVMELIEGESLRSRLRREGALSPDLAIEIARQCALAVGAAHKRGIVHRDLKPDNIMLVSDSELSCGLRAKILDFGIAKLADSAGGAGKTRPDLVMGTPEYMSPEQCRGAGSVDHRADIYSLACVLFEMVCERPPFVSESHGELIAAQLTKRPPSPRSFHPELSVDLEVVILQALRKNADARTATMQELAASLERLQKESHPPPPAAVSQPSLTREIPPPPATLDPVRSETTLRGSAAELTQLMVSETRTRWSRVVAAGAVLVALSMGIVLIRGASRQGTAKEGNRAIPSTLNVDAFVITQLVPDNPGKINGQTEVRRQVRLTINSRPTGAEVYRTTDGKRVGKTPFVDIRDSSLGQAEYLLLLDGYREARAKVRGDRDADLTEQLEPLPRADRKAGADAGLAPLAAPAAPSHPTGDHTTTIDPFADVNTIDPFKDPETPRPRARNARETVPQSVELR